MPFLRGKSLELTWICRRLTVEHIEALKLKVEERRKELNGHHVLMAFIGRRRKANLLHS
jgi:hypothetical protein